MPSPDTNTLLFCIATRVFLYPMCLKRWPYIHSPRSPYRKKNGGLLLLAGALRTGLGALRQDAVGTREHLNPRIMPWESKGAHPSNAHSTQEVIRPDGQYWVNNSLIRPYSLGGLALGGGLGPWIPMIVVTSFQPGTLTWIRNFHNISLH